MRTVIRFVFFGLFLSTAFAQTQLDVVEVLKKISETYRGVSQYEFEVNIKSDSGGAPSTVHQHVAFMRGKYRIEGPMPGQQGDGDTTIVHDGSLVWFYSTKSNEYGSIAASALTQDAPGDAGDLMPEAVDYYLMWRWRGAADFSTGAQLVREEMIRFANSTVPTYVLTVIAARRGESGLAFTWWVDKKTYRVLREDSPSGSAVFTSLRLDEPIRDELFKFVPPAGARKMEAPK